ncbi:hypothetical protein [Streptodolium elevatio]|uniref:hypothetical protein n=1 Tax=Streptodolium elevatio TaxID=3157996 RepID=UPI003F4D2ED6
MDEEAYQSVRAPGLLEDDECLLPWAVGLDINTAFLAAAARMNVGLGAPTHVHAPAFDKTLPGSWLVDLSRIELVPRLPSPFTPIGKRPDGPAWYATPTVAYAVELGAKVRTLEAFLRHEKGACLDPGTSACAPRAWRRWRTWACRSARKATSRTQTNARTWPRWKTTRASTPVWRACFSAIKATVKGGVGKLRERPQGRHYREGERWGALERPTWRPDIRAAIISKARVKMHRKMVNTAQATGRYPVAGLSDCVVYASPTTDPLGFLPLTDVDHKLGAGHVLPGSFRLGATPGLAKVESVQELLAVIDQMEQGLNPARHIKGGDAVLDEGE